MTIRADDIRHVTTEQQASSVASEVVSAVLIECWLDWDTDGLIVATSLEISTMCVGTLP